MIPDLHLVLELESWVPLEGRSEPLIKLKTYLGAHDNLTLTLVSENPLWSGLEQLGARDSSFPDHFISDGGLAIYHARKNGSWAEDAEYRHWVGARWDPLVLERVAASRGFRCFRQVLGAHSPRRAVFTVAPDQSLRRAAEELEACLALTPFDGRIVVAGDNQEVVPRTVGFRTAATYLHQHLPGPPAMMACGCKEGFLEVLQLAEYPVLLAGGPMGIDNPGLPKGKVYFSPKAGPSGILDTLLGLDQSQRYVGCLGA